LTSRIFTRSPTRKAPVDSRPLGAGRSVDQLRAHVGRRRHAVDLDHVVFPLDAAGVVGVALAGMVVFATRVAAFAGGRPRHELRRHQLHAALRAAVRLVAPYLGVHRTGVGDRRDRGSEQLHAALRALAGLVPDHLRMHRAHIGHRGARRDLWLPHVHLRHERERFVRLGVEIGSDALALSAMSLCVRKFANSAANDGSACSSVTAMVASG
jgi:hypothetical protein